MKDAIFIKGAKEHNLKNINLQLPRNKLIVITGLSGSGKSSLAFDTLYAEGQRRYVESLSSYARQFLGRMEKPEVDCIEGLSPAISIDQKGASKNPRSTVGTTTEIYDYLRLLFARIGIPHCPKCSSIISPQTIDQMIDQIMKYPGQKIQILAPMIKGRKGEYQKLIKDIIQKGYTKVRVDNIVYEADENIPLERYKTHNIEVIVDRLIVKENISSRLSDSLEVALKLSAGDVLIWINQEKEILFNQKLSCAKCGINFEDLEPRLFSFNSPYGACPECTGIGKKIELDIDLLIPDKTKSITSGAVIPWGKPVFNFKHHAYLSWFWKKLYTAADHYNIDLEKPLQSLSKKHKDIILYGAGGGEFFEGAINNLKRRYKETESEYVRSEIEKFMADHPCPACRGARLKEAALSVNVGNSNIASLTGLPVKEFYKFFEELKLNNRDQFIALEIIKEIKARSLFMLNVGLDYLTLDRTTSTLSGGEAQRIRLATQIGSGLVGVLYVLDEPSIGLHQRDNKRLLKVLQNLRDIGNTVIVIEHDEETIRSADHIVDIGPEAGEDGGYLVAQGKLKDILNCKKSYTGKYLKGDLWISLPKKRRKTGGKTLKIIGAAENNLKNINITIPLGLFICITGVSGSGKSTLVDEILYKALAAKFYQSFLKPGRHKEIQGYENIDKVIIIDQSPIGRTPRSNPATYTGGFDPIRRIFSITSEAKMRGYKPGRFSFNVKGGRCDACQGQGILQIEMHFLPDVYVPCEACKGKRYNRETLEVHYKGKNIAEVLDMTVDEAQRHFKNIPVIHNKLKLLQEVGLGYIKVGQPATTLSGGEAQRVKLSTELSKRATGKTLYILDEPTTGLHFHDVAKLLKILNYLVDAGNTVLVIEHNLQVIKCADHIIDLGPEGGDMGGRIVAEGTPEEVSRHPKSYTGIYLKNIIKKKNEDYADYVNVSA